MLVKDASESFANVADNTSTGLVLTVTVAVILQPELSVFIPEILTTTTAIEGGGLTAKIINTAAGGKEFSLTDMIGDGLGIATGTGKGVPLEALVKAIEGAAVDQGLDAVEAATKEIKKDENKVNETEEEKENE